MRFSSSRSGAAEPLITIAVPSAFCAVQLEVREHLARRASRSRSSRASSFLLGGDEGRAPAQRLLAREPEGALRRGVPERDHALEIGGVDRDRRSLDDRREEPVGRLQRPVPGALLGEVDERADHEARHARGVAHDAAHRGAPRPSLPSRRRMRFSGHGRGLARIAQPGESRLVAAMSSGWVSMRKLAPRQLLLRIAADLAERAIDDEVLAVEGDQREADGSLVEGLANEIELSLGPAPAASPRPSTA